MWLSLKNSFWQTLQIIPEGFILMKSFLFYPPLTKCFSSKYDLSERYFKLGAFWHRSWILLRMRSSGRQMYFLTANNSIFWSNITCRLTKLNEQAEIFYHILLVCCEKKIKFHQKSTTWTLWKMFNSKESHISLR